MNEREHLPIESLNEPAPYLSLSIEELDQRLAAEYLEERLELGCAVECVKYCFLP